MLPARCNVGLLLRWSAAVREMRSFYSVPDYLQSGILRELADVVWKSMESTPGIVPLRTDVLDRGELSSADCWDRVPTIFSFRVAQPDASSGTSYLTHDQMQALHRRLNSDLSAIPELRNSDSQRSLAALLCHVGKPVDWCRTSGRSTSVLRICTGANVVSRVMFDATLGRTLEERIEFERQRIGRVFEKIALILAHWTSIDQYETAISTRSDQRMPGTSPPLPPTEIGEALMAIR